MLGRPKAAEKRIGARSNKLCYGMRMRMGPARDHQRERVHLSMRGEHPDVRSFSVSRVEIRKEGAGLKWRAFNSRGKIRGRC